tara:strand:- start:751 stop:960 length:210 start_codon:yes stop_codon:yes gene_type:complete
MSKRKILVDGEVRLVTNSEWLKLQSDQTATDLAKAKPAKQPKLSIKDVQVETDPISSEPNEQDQDNSEE